MKSRHFTISLVLHFSLVATFFLSAATQKKLDPVNIDLQMIQPPKQVAKQLATQKSAYGGSSRSKNLNASLKTKHDNEVRRILGLEPITENLAARIESYQARAVGGNWAKPNSYTSDPFTDFQNMNMSQIKFIKSLYRQIDNSIIDSPYLSEYGHVGQVFLRFELSAEGKIIETTLNAKADDNILKVIAARAVRKAIKNDSQELVLPTQKVQIQTRFSWADKNACKDLKGIHQNYLSFCKYGEDKRKQFTSGEKASTYLSSLAYGFGAIDEIKKYKNEEKRKKSNFDPFEEMRRDPDFNLGG